MDSKSVWRVLTLVRHAKSSWDQADLSDFERPLNKRGIKDAPKMGRRLHAEKFKLDLILTSPAVRAQTTAEYIASELGYENHKIKREQAIYEASLHTLLYLVSGLDDRYQHVMLVGHNPGFTLLCNYLSNAGIKNMPTCSVAQIRFHNKSWQSVSEHSAELIDFDYPKKK